MSNVIKIEIKFVGDEKTIALTWVTEDQLSMLKIPDKAIPALIHDLAQALVERQSKIEKQSE